MAILGINAYFNAINESKISVSKEETNEQVSRLLDETKLTTAEKAVILEFVDMKGNPNGLHLVDLIKEAAKKKLNKKITSLEKHLTPLTAANSIAEEKEEDEKEEGKKAEEKDEKEEEVKESTAMYEEEEQPGDDEDEKEGEKEKDEKPEEDEKDEDEKEEDEKPEEEVKEDKEEDTFEAALAKLKTKFGKS